MPFKLAALLCAALMLAACAADQPTIIQPTPGMSSLNLTPGMATQVEMPDAERVRSVVTGDPSIVKAASEGDVVSLIPGKVAGETNLIVRASDTEGEVKVYQYRVVVGK